jgi:hypothetical protein
MARQERSNADKASARYEHATPQNLARTAPMAPLLPRENAKSLAQWADMRQHLETRLMMLRSWRTSEIEHDALVAQYLLPRRSQWLTQGGDQQPVPNSMIRNLPINQAILDPTGTQAMRVAAAGMVEGLMSPSRPWFKLSGPKSFAPDRAATLWFEEVQERMYAIMAHSNFYDCGAQMMEDLIAYGTGPMLIYEDDDDVIRCYNPCVGEYYLGLGATNRVEVFNRLFVFTVSQMVEMWGLDACPQDVQTLWSQKGASLDQERIVAHSIEPNFEIQRPGDPSPYGKVSGGFTYREVYWVYGASVERPLSVHGFMDEPFIAPRFWLRPNSAYGDCPGKDALPDIMQLQQETMRKAELLEKHVRPPLNVPVELKNQPSSILPGRQNYTSDTSKGIKAVFEVNPQAMQHISNDLALIQQRIKVGFFNDLFLMLAQATKDMTAYEVAQRQQEKLQVLGPVIERFNNEAASKAIKRVFAIMMRKQLIPPLPKSLQGVSIQIEYISMLALAQRAVATAGIERLLAVQGKMAGTNQDVLDLIDDDEVIREYADQLGVTQKVLRSPEAVAQIRAQRAKVQAAAARQAQMAHAATEITPALADAAKTLSDTDVGGGMNAAQLMLGGVGGQQPGAMQ